MPLDLHTFLSDNGRRPHLHFPTLASPPLSPLVTLPSFIRFLAYQASHPVSFISDFTMRLQLNYELRFDINYFSRLVSTLIPSLFVNQPPPSPFPHLPSPAPTTLVPCLTVCHREADMLLLGRQQLLPLPSRPPFLPVRKSAPPSVSCLSGSPLSARSFSSHHTSPGHHTLDRTTLTVLFNPLPSLHSFLALR